MTTQDKIVSKAGFLTVTLNEDPNYLLFKWENFGISMKDCQDAFAQAEKALVDRGLHCIVSIVMQKAFSVSQAEALVRSFRGAP